MGTRHDWLLPHLQEQHSRHETGTGDTEVAALEPQDEAQLVVLTVTCVTCVTSCSSQESHVTEQGKWSRTHDEPTTPKGVTLG